VVDDQYGCPTYAADLAQAIMTIVGELAMNNKQSAISNRQATIFNYCNSGITTWFGFASAIKELSGSSCIVNPIPTSAYPTPAKRPHYSVLDTSKIQHTFGIIIPDWKVSLEKCIDKLMNGE